VLRISIGAGRWRLVQLVLVESAWLAFLATAIGAWFAFYNGRRPHQALGNRAPMQVWREGTTGALGETAVDMTLRLDNAGALPTCPQPQQLQKMIA